MVGKTYLLAQNLNFRYVFYIESTLFKVMDSDVMLCIFYFYIYYIFNSYYKSAATYIGSSDKRNHDSPSNHLCRVLYRNLVVPGTMVQSLCRSTNYT